jgi:hypothetical protein
MFLLVAFLHVVPPMLIGEFATRDECERVRAELVSDPSGRELARTQLVCLGPDRETERKRFEPHR